MSLVNRMLLDLEERQSALHGEPALAGLSSVDYCVSEGRRSRRNGWALLIAAASILAFLAVLQGWPRVDHPGPAHISVQPARANKLSMPVPQPQPVPQSQKPAAPPEPMSPMSLQRDETLLSLAYLSTQQPATEPREQIDPVPVTAAPISVSGVELQAHEDTVDVNITLTGAARFAIYPLFNPDRLVVEIAGATLSDALSQTNASGLVRRVRARHERGKALLVLDLAGPVQIESSKMETTDGAAQLRVQLAGGDPAPAGADPAANAADSPVTAPEIVEPGQLTRNPRSADRLYDEGAALCSNGNVVAGLAKLTELVALDPGHVAGRQLLATVLIQHGDPGEAAAILEAGLQKNPRIWQWAQLRAQLAVNAGDPERAHGILVNAPPPLAEQPEYHALLAAVQQRTGRHGEAINTYHSILGREPERGIWWMGLGISLQALARDREAGFAFRRALGDSSLTPDLRSFVQTRMASLSQ